MVVNSVKGASQSLLTSEATMKVSVIIPTHKRPRLLRRAVESARAAGVDVEIIVVDDASTDATAEVCRSLKGIKYLRLDRNQGVAAARNRGFMLSTAEFVCFLDDDDQRLPGSFDLQLKALISRPDAGFVCGAVLYSDQSGNLTGKGMSPSRNPANAFWDLLEWNFFALPVSIVIRKSCLLRAGLFKSGLDRIDDWDLCVRLAALFPVITVDEPVGIYRLPTRFSDQGSSNLAPNFIKASRHQKTLFKLPQARSAPPSKLRATRRRSLNRFADILFQRAATSLIAGQYRTGCADFLTGLRLSPRRLIRPSIYRTFLVYRTFLKDYLAQQAGWSRASGQSD